MQLTPSSKWLLALLFLLLAVPVTSQSLEGQEMQKSVVLGYKVDNYVEHAFAQAKMAVYPEQAVSTNHTFTQQVDLTNNLEDPVYIFFDAYYDKAVDEITTDGSSFKLEQGVKPDHSEQTGVEKSKGDWAYTLWGDQNHYFNTKGRLVMPGENYTTNLTFTTNESSGKWNARVWGSKDNDWQCVLDSRQDCLYDYAIDPSFSINQSDNSTAAASAIRLSFSTAAASASQYSTQSFILNTTGTGNATIINISLQFRHLLGGDNGICTINISGVNSTEDSNGSFYGNATSFNASNISNGGAPNIFNFTFTANQPSINVATKHAVVVSCTDNTNIFPYGSSGDSYPNGKFRQKDAGAGWNDGSLGDFFFTIGFNYTAPDPPVLDCGYTMNDTTTLNSSYSCQDNFLRIGLSNVTLDCAGNNITYGIAGSSNSTGIFANQVSNITVKNCNFIDGNSSGDQSKGINFTSVNMSTIQNVSINTSGVANDYGIVLMTASQNNTIKQVLIRTTGTSVNNTGIVIIASNRNNITDSNIFTNGTTDNVGIYLFSNSHNNSVIRNNITTDGTGASNHGIYTQIAANTQIINNSIFTNGTTGNFGMRLRSGANDVNVTGNTIRLNGTSGLRAIEGSATTLRLNVTNNYLRIFGTSTGFGVVFNSVTGSTIQNNTIENLGLTGSGISFENGATTSYVFNNYIKGEVAGQVVGIDLNPTSTSVHNNTFTNNFINTNSSSSGAGIFVDDFSTDNRFNGTILNFTGAWITGAGNSLNNFSNQTFLTPNGSINYTGQFTLNGTKNITQNILNVSLYRAFVNSTAVPELNTSARIRLNSVTFASPSILVDFTDTNTFGICSTTVCTQESYLSNIFVFNVTRFTTYIVASLNTSIVVVNQTFQNPAFETANYNYTINISTGENLTPTSAVNLSLNGTTYIASQLLNGSDGFNNSWSVWNVSNVRMPLVSVNLTNWTFNWTYQYAFTTNSTLLVSNTTTNETQGIIWAFYPETIIHELNTTEATRINWTVNSTNFGNGSGVTFIFNTTWNSTQVAGMEVSNSTNQTRTNYSFEIPLLNENTFTNQSFNLTPSINITFNGVNVQRNTTLKVQQTVNKLIFTNCTGGNTTMTGLGYEIRDLDNNALIGDADLTGTFVAYTTNQSLNRTYTLSYLNNATPSVCRFPSFHEILMTRFTSVSATGYTTATETVTNLSLNLNSSVVVFLTNTTAAATLTVTVVDQNNAVLSGYTVEVYRVNSTGGLALVDTEVTNVLGQVQFSLVFTGIQYQFRVKNPAGNTVLTSPSSGGMTLTANTLTLKVFLVNPITLGNLITMRSIAHNLTYNNATKIVQLDWYDPSNFSSNNCLQVLNMTNGNGSTLSNNCSASNSGTFRFNVTNINEYMFARYIATSSNDSLNYVLETIDVDNTNRISFGTEGIFLAFILIGVMSAIGAYIRPSLGILFLELGIVGAFWMNILPIGWISLMGIVIAGIFTAFVVEQ